MRCIIIPSIAVSMLPDSTITLTLTKLTWDEFVTALLKCQRVINYIRHKPTIDLLTSTVAKLEAGFEYRVDINDVIFIVGLRARAPTPGADVIVNPNDLLIYLAKVQT